MIKVINEVQIIERDGKEVSIPRPAVEVISHWNINTWVVLKICGEVITVSAQDLKDAINNATNNNRFGS